MQKPHPPIYLAAYAPTALKRAATMANGWMLVGIPLDAIAAMITQLRQMAKDAGRDPLSLEVIVGANISITLQPLGTNRAIFTGSLNQVKKDVDDVKKLGANEIFFMIFRDGPMGGFSRGDGTYRSLV